MPPFLGHSTSSTGYLSCLVCALFLVSGTRGASPTAHANSGGESEGGDSSGRRDRAFGHSAKIDATNNSPALNNFLEDVLNAQEELKWIDQAVHLSDTRNVDPSTRRRKEVDGKSRRESHMPRRVYLQNEAIAKRQANEEPSAASSLASLKRTVLELSDSLNPRECEKSRGEPGTADSKRRLLWSEDIASSIGVAVAYYDYEDDAEAGSPVVNLPVERNPKREESPGPPGYLPVKVQIPKKDENAEEEKKEERERQKLKNKYPKEEFIGDMPESKGESKTGKKKSQAPSSSLNSMYNSMVLKRIPSETESDDHDSYSRCMVGSPREPDSSSGGRKKNPALQADDSLGEQHETQAIEDEPEISVERTYLVLSPEVEKRSRKRSLDIVESIVAAESLPSRTSDKSARNYFALKITDDMFKGGVEQRNPLGEDKPILERIESPRLSSSSSSSSFSSSGGENSFGSLRSSKTTSPEWKVIEVVEEKIYKPQNSMHSKRGFGRRLAQIFTDESPDRVNMSSTCLFPTVNSQLPNATAILPTTGAANESLPNNDPTKDLQGDTEWDKIREMKMSEPVSNADSSRDQNAVTERDNIQELTITESIEHKNFSTTLRSLPRTHYVSHRTTPLLDDSKAISEIYNNTRLRRHAPSFGHDDLSRSPRHRVHHEHFQESEEEQKRLSVEPVEGDAHHRKLTVLLAADNIEDESQIDLAVHGELAGKIVERIFEEVQRNEGLKVALGPGLYRKHKPQESMALDKMYRQGLDEDEVKETEAMMRRVMELLGRLVLDEVRRKTCASLAPDMRDFLQWSLGLEELEPLSDQIPPLPLILNHRHDATEKGPPSADKFLFESSPDRDLQSDDLSELERKVSLIRSLINEYHSLTEREKTKVQTVHDYLVRQLGLLMKYIESKETASRGQVAEQIKTAGARLPAGRQQILQYQGSMPNLAKNPRGIFNGSELEATKTSNASSTIDGRVAAFSYFNDASDKTSRRGVWSDRRRKQEAHDSRRVRRKRVKNHPEDDATVESPEYSKLLRRIATLRRRKRENSWGYEKPRIYIGPLDSPLSSQPRVSLSTSADPEQPPPAAAAPLSHSDPPASSSTPVRGKNRLEDEVLLLNKREAWKKENERLLEEVAFGRDTRNDLTSGDENTGDSPDRDQELRIKRAFAADALSSSTTPSVDISINGDDKVDLRSVERKINVFPVGAEDRRTAIANSFKATDATTES